MSKDKKNIKKRQEKINNLYLKIRNIVKELHNKMANYLCKKYKKIVVISLVCLRRTNLPLESTKPRLPINIVCTAKY